MDQYINQDLFGSDDIPQQDALETFDFDSFTNDVDMGYDQVYDENILNMDFNQGPPLPNYDTPVSINPNLTSIPRLSPILSVEIPSTPATAPAPAAEPTRYLNPILTSFQDPATPLKVFDDFFYPFDPSLQQALEDALQKEAEAQPQTHTQTQTQDQELGNMLDGFFQEGQAQTKVQEIGQVVMEPTRNTPFPLLGPTSTPPVPLRHTPTPPSSPIQTTEGKQPRNKRPQNIKSIQPTKHYLPLRSAPQPWGPQNPTTNSPLFTYLPTGELHPTLQFSPSQILTYISQHPLHTLSSAYNPSLSGLTLFIQTVPADSSKRYSHKNSDKCRFKNCLDPYHTIRKGDFRVAFDEQFVISGLKYDPFHAAMYVHLSCLERFLDFPQICKIYNVRPDTRNNLPEGKSRFAVTRDHYEMKGVVRRFVRDSVSWGQGQKGEGWYRFTLNYELTKEHLERQSPHLKTVRERRGGNHVGLHMNDLEVWVRLQGEMKKRKREEVEEEGEDVLDENILEERGSKRVRY